MWTCPLSNKALSKINNALIKAKFSAIDIERVIEKDFLLEYAIRHEPSSITTTINLCPDVARIFFKFGDVKKLGMRFRYPPIDADDDKIDDFIDNIMAAVESAGQ